MTQKAKSGNSFYHGSRILLVVLSVFVLVLFIWPSLRWATIDSVWRGVTPELCGSEISDPQGTASSVQQGACWPAVWANLRLIFFYRYPEDQLWRAVSSCVLLLLGIYGILRKNSSVTWRIVCYLGAIALPLILLGGVQDSTLVPVEVANWGGLLLTIIFGIYGAFLALPVGILLAVARRSKLPVIAGCATIWIELVRAVPLITILFVANYLFPMFLPHSWPTPPLFLRALVAVGLFGGVYIAEVVRGGLQSLKPGQVEAGLSLGLNSWQLQALILLPQALRHALPALVSTVIGLVKDTSLVSTIGMFDLLGVVRGIPANPEWIGFDIEVLITAAVLYWTICWSIARVGQQLEDRYRIKAI